MYSVNASSGRIGFHDVRKRRENRYVLTSHLVLRGSNFPPPPWPAYYVAFCAQTVFLSKTSIHGSICCVIASLVRHISSQVYARDYVHHTAGGISGGNACAKLARIISAQYRSSQRHRRYFSS